MDCIEFTQIYFEPLRYVVHKLYEDGKVEISWWQGGDQEFSKTRNFSLQTTERIFGLLRRSNFFDLPKNYESGIVCSPRTRQVLSAEIGGRRHEVSWEGGEPEQISKMIELFYDNGDWDFGSGWVIE